MENRDEKKVPLLQESPDLEAYEAGLGRRILIESKKLWRIVGPAIISRVALYAMNVTAQAFAGHLGDLELAAFSISNTVLVGFVFGLLLGMASALETLCGQAFGAKKYHMMGIYMQRSWVALFCICILLTPIYIFATPILELMGQPRDIAVEAGSMSLWMLPLHFSFAMQFPLQRFLQCQMKNPVIAYSAGVGFVIHVFISWLFVYRLHLGIIGATCALNFSWWAVVFGQLGYVMLGGCPLTWTGFSMDAFSGLWDFFKLSVASGVMLCLENWYYRILILLTGNLKNAEVALDALSICMSLNGWELMIPLAFFAATGRMPRKKGKRQGAGFGVGSPTPSSTSFSGVMNQKEIHSIWIFFDLEVQPCCSAVSQKLYLYLRVCFFSRISYKNFLCLSFLDMMRHSASYSIYKCHIS